MEQIILALLEGTPAGLAVLAAYIVMDRRLVVLEAQIKYLLKTED